MELADDLLAYVDASPSPYHAVAETVRRLAEAGFTALDEAARWSLAPGDARYAVRDGSSVVAFRVGSAGPADAGFRVVGAHTDSPTLAVRPRPDLVRHGWRQVGVEVYGSPLLYTWLDRDLTVAGRLLVRDGADADGADVTTRLVRLPGAPLRVPSLATHLQRELRENGLKLNPQHHLQPVWSTDRAGPRAVLDVLAAHAGVDPDAVLGHDLVAADTQPSARGGADGEFVFAPRLDNLSSCHAGTVALARADAGAATQVLVANDHEEVGSGSAEGARGSLLADVLARVVVATGDADAQSLPRALARSLVVSADAAHALHPNFADRHEPGHAPRLGGGVVLKVNAGQAYASDGASWAALAARCADAGRALQVFASRADFSCGSTIGPLTATRLGVATVDLGAPLLSMHSIREQAAAADVDDLVAVLTAHLAAP